MNQKELDIAQDFKSITDAEWKELIIKDLKGKDFAETLEWNDANQLTFQPYYRSSDLKKIAKPERFRFLSNDWIIQQNFAGNQAKNAIILDALSKGLDGIGIALNSSTDLAELLKGVYIDAIALNLHGEVSTDTLKQLDQLIEEKAIAPDSIRGLIDFSPLTASSKMGKGKELDNLAEIISIYGDKYTHLKLIHIDARIVKNAGGNESQEIAFALSQLNEYIDQLTKQGIDISVVLENIAFSFSFGTSYFLEIAKIRAFRFLYSGLCQQYGHQVEPTIFAETASIVYSGADSYTNLLRATTASMSAVIGGCNYLNVLPHDIALEESSDFAQRIARNIQIVVKEEGHLAKVADAGAGSYYIEQMRDELAKKGWDIFQLIESKGGYMAALKSNFIQEEILNNKLAIQKELENQSKVMIGVNKFQPEEKGNQKLKEEVAVNGVEFKALNEVRWATPFEK